MLSTHQSEDLVLLIKEGVEDGVFEVVSQIPDEPHHPFLIKLSITEEEQGLLRWYIEQGHIRQPGTDELSERAESLVKSCGRDYFHQLFSNQSPLYSWWQQASSRKAGRIVIVSNSPKVHHVHWEFLRDETQDMPLFALGIRIVRKLQISHTGEHNLVSLSSLTQDDKIRILVVRPRPKSEYLQLPEGSISDELIKLENIIVKVCHPPTLEQLRIELEFARNSGKPFSIVHFDGHGLYKDGRGALIFEGENGERDVAYDDRLGIVFRGVPVVVLDACRTSDTGGPAWEAVAPLLLKLGVSSVIAMPYAAHIDMMRHLFRTFYHELAARKTIGIALNEGRRAVLISEIRRARPDSTSQESATIRDWWVPQLFQGLKDHALLPPEIGEDQASAGITEANPKVKIKHHFRRRTYALIAFALIVASGIAVHLRLFDSAVKKRHDADADCNNGHNVNQCGIALELNKECCGNHEFGWQECCYQTGLLYEDKKPSEPALAARYYEKACNTTESMNLACLNLGMLSQTGFGFLKKDLRKAVDLFTKACQGGRRRSCSNTGRTYLMLYNQTAQQADSDNAKRYFELACSSGQGDPRGCTGLGTWYADNRQRENAFQAYQLACEGKDAQGCAGMGDVADRLSDKVNYYRRACSMNDAENNCPGCIDLALLYESGDAEKMSANDASALYEKLCDQGCGEGGSRVPEACWRLGYNFRGGTGGRPRDLSKAEEYFQKGCDRSDGISCSWLGWLRQEHDPKSAMQLFSNACATDTRLGCCMASEFSSKQGNKAEAKHYRTLACELDPQCCPEFPEAAQIDQ